MGETEEIANERKLQALVGGCNNNNNNNNNKHLYSAQTKTVLGALQ
jgi:hypothetical protein